MVKKTERSEVSCQQINGGFVTTNGGCPGPEMSGTEVAHSSYHDTRITPIG